MSGTVSSPKSGWALEQAAQGCMGGEEESPSLEVFKEAHGDVTLRDTVSTMGWVGVALDDLRGLFQP